MAKKKELGDPRVAELTDTLKRVQAEFENYKKRVEKDTQNRAAYSCSDIILKILPVVDNLDLALRNTCDQEELIKGVQMIGRQFIEILEKEGLSRIETVGCAFDPYLHEAMMTEVSDKDNIILEEYQPGYRLNGRVIRHARVKVGKKGEDNKADPEGGPRTKED